MPDDAQAPEPPAAKRRWVAPTLTAHASLTALTQMQYPQDAGGDPGFGGPQAVPCSQGFCPPPTQ